MKNMMRAINGSRIIAIAAPALLGLGLLWAGSASAQQGHPHERMPNVMEYIDRLDRPERDQEQKPAQVVDEPLVAVDPTEPARPPSRAV